METETGKLTEGATPKLSVADDAGLAQLLAGEGAAESWRTAHHMLACLLLEGDDGVRRLSLSVDVLLVGRRPQEQFRLRLRLQSDAWAHPGAWPPVHSRQALGAEVPGDPATPLAFRIVEAERRDTARAEESFWLRYLTPDARALPPALAAPVERARSPLEAFSDRLGEWLHATLAVGTVGGAVQCAETGPAGVFGAVESRVLERSGESDLAADVTTLAEVDDGDSTGAEPGVKLALLGERHGSWLLHRCVRPLRGKRRPEGPAAGPWHCTVLLADSAGELMQLAGLGPLEKQLFQAGGILQPVSLRALRAEEEATPEPAGEQLVDLGPVPERTRRYLRALIALAAEGRLTPAGADTLLRVARQLGRS